MLESLDMGKYAYFVWTSYGLWALLFVALVVAARVRHGRVLKELEQRVQREAQKKEREAARNAAEATS